MERNKLTFKKGDCVILNPLKIHPAQRDVFAKYKNTIGIIININDTDKEVAILWPKDCGLSLWWSCDAVTP
jgi:hypothetical protein